MKNSTTLPSLANKYLNSLADENEEPIYTYNDEYTRHFERKSIKKGICSSLNQWYISSFSDNVFNVISQELNVQFDICKIIDN